MKEGFIYSDTTMASDRRNWLQKLLARLDKPSARLDESSLLYLTIIIVSVSVIILEVTG